MLENYASERGAECSNCLPTQKLENRASKLDQSHVLFGTKEEQRVSIFSHIK